MSDELPWPRAGDMVFSSDGYWFNACVGYAGDDWHMYIRGYKLAADLLVQYVTDQQRAQDSLIYPIVFLYRQAVELCLKCMIWVGSQLQGKPPVLLTHHRLLPLWRQCRPIIEEVWPDGPKQVLDAVEAALDQFDANDPVSTTFRYPVTKEGRPSLSISKCIDIQHFAEVVNRVLGLLDSCACEFSEYLKYYKSDMEREYTD